MNKIDLTKPVAFYDDRNKYDIDYLLTEILYKKDNLCVCKIATVVRPNSRLAEEISEAKKNKEIEPWWKVSKEETIFFDIENREVLHKDFDSWMATNDLTIHGRYQDITKEKTFNNSGE